MGGTISSDHAYLQSFVAAFAAHPKNRLAERYGPIRDEITRAGEILRPFRQKGPHPPHHPTLAAASTAWRKSASSPPPRSST